MHETLVLFAVFALLLAWQRYAPAGERGAFDLSALLPNGSVSTGAGFNPGATVDGKGATPGAQGPETAPSGNRWGFERFVNLGGRALNAYRGWQGAGVHGFMDVSDPGQLDDQEMAKMIAQYGAIPADSDLGELAVAAGARTYKQRVKFSDGSSSSIEVVQVGSRRGGADSPEGRARTRRKNLTSNRLATAAWVMRKLHAQQKLGRRLARVAAKLYPQRRGGGKAKRKR